jgi:hypothetical protein
MRLKRCELSREGKISEPADYQNCLHVERLTELFLNLLHLLHTRTEKKSNVMKDAVRAEERYLAVENIYKDLKYSLSFYLISSVGLCLKRVMSKNSNRNI